MTQADGQPGEPALATAAEPALRVHLDELLHDRRMTLEELSTRVGIDRTNLSRLKNGRVSFIRLETLTALCRELGCQPGDLLSYE